MRVPEELRYTRDHEWVAIDESTGRVRMGITDFAQDALGEVVFVQAPEKGYEAQAGLRFGEVESSKSVSDVYAPVSGSVIEVNAELGESPQLINDDPYGRGWLCVLQLAEGSELDHLLDAASYRALVGPWDDGSQHADAG